MKFSDSLEAAAKLYLGQYLFYSPWTPEMHIHVTEPANQFLFMWVVLNSGFN